MEGPKSSAVNCGLNENTSKDDRLILSRDTYVTRSLKQERQCSICLDTFKYPKLLPCIHTFCATCLTTYMRKTKDRNKVRCPLCRKISRVSSAGDLDCFMNNYFVESKRISICSNSTCVLCHKSDDVTECFQCEIKLCQDCAAVHEQTCSDKGEKESDEDEISRDSDDVQTPLFLLFSLDFIRIKTITKLVSSFAIGGNGTGFINSLCPTGENFCWVLASGGPETGLYDVKGREIQRFSVGGGLSDILVRSDGSLLVSVWNKYYNIVQEITGEGDLMLFASCDKHKPAAISSFPDGRIVVVGPYDSKEETENNPGTVLIYSEDGDLISDIGQKDGPIFERPYGVAVNPVFGFICVTDEKKKTVYILSEDGDVLGTYKGGSCPTGPLGLFLGQGRQNFRPVGICCDLDGNVIVCDVASKALHMLNPFGEFIGLLLTNHEEGFGNPSSVAVDKSGRIWVGDGCDGTVRIFEVTSYNNTLGRDPQ